MVELQPVKDWIPLFPNIVYLMRIPGGKRDNDQPDHKQEQAPG